MTSSSSVEPWRITSSTFAPSSRYSNKPSYASHLREATSDTLAYNYWLLLLHETSYLS